MPTPPTILFVGGGTGGHIFPNLAVLERLRELCVEVEPHFVVSDRPLDGQILEELGLAYTALPAIGLSPKPGRLVRFVPRFARSRAMVRTLIERTGASAMIATGGFVSGPAIAAGAQARVPVAMVSLDAVPGRANRWAARAASDVFVVGDGAMSGALPSPQPIGFPLRRSLLEPVDPGEAKRQLGLDPDRPTLLVTAGSQGATSVNRAVIELLARPEFRGALAGWHVLHAAGRSEVYPVREAYDVAGVLARVEPFIAEMGLAWSAADLAIGRAGAGSVAEALAAAAPSVFLPYPYHRDEHQRHNAAPLVNAGGAVMFSDRIDAAANAEQLADPLTTLLTNADCRRRMREALRAIAPADGAMALARWAQQQLGE